jgi:hypothetical protein
MIAHRSDPVSHAHPPGEIEMCLRLSTEVATIMEGICADWGSEGPPVRGTEYFLPFFRTANERDPTTRTITREFIRTIFGGTLNPRCDIIVEPLTRESNWWESLTRAYASFSADYRDATLARWSAMIDWFSRQSIFRDTSFVRIRERSGHAGSVFPQFALGLTQMGSLTGLIGNGVHT